MTSPPRLALALLLAAAPPARALEDRPIAGEIVRFGVERDVFRGVNHNDATVALATYGKLVGEEFGVPVKVAILDGPHAARDALKRREIDVLNISPTGLLDLDDEDVEGPLLASSSGSSPFERYVLLVRADAAIGSVEDLRGRSLVRSDDQRSSLARIWLEVLLHQHGLGSQHALRTVEVTLKPAQAILPVFFGKYDACVATRSAWDVMGELNPQVKAQLRPIAESQPFMTGLALFRRGIPGPLKQRILEVIGSSGRSPAFRQLLTLYRITNVVPQPDSALDSTRQLLESYRRLTLDSKASGPRRTPARSASRGR